MSAAAPPSADPPAVAAGAQAVRQLCAARAGAHCVETHISWVLLAGDDAYKIKKPLQLDFLDFSTIERRHAACLEELRINRRTAPGLYLRVVPITGRLDAPAIGGERVNLVAQPRVFALEFVQCHRPSPASPCVGRESGRARGVTPPLE